MNLNEAILKLPKTDLHCHLDGSLRPETILDLARSEKIDLGISDLKELKRLLLCGQKISTLEDFLRGFKITTPVMQTREGLERVAFELAEDAANENVRWLEVRFTPIWCTEKGLTHREVLLAARRGLEKAEKIYPIRTGLIVCAIRILDPSLSVELARLAISLVDHGVVGFDLAHAERGHPPGQHAEAFTIAKDAGLGLTVHAGEDAGPESIEEALNQCHAQRIGHGLTLGKDSKLKERVIAEGIAVESCPSSNVQINLLSSWKQHPVRDYLRQGVKITLNTDNRLMTGVRVTDEYLRAHQHLGMTWEELTTVALNGFHAAFIAKRERKSLIASVEKEIAAMSVHFPPKNEH